MKINADLSQRAAVDSEALPWVPSPMPGVERRMLERDGEEVARVTSIVRYAPNSYFSEHSHSGGEEYLVLKGTFSDNYGDFPAGSYIRNPPQSSHTPGSEEGCTIFVKLWQFDPDDRTHVRIDTNKMPLLGIEGREGVEIMPLFRDAYEDVRIERWAPGADIVLSPEGGLELLVLEGGFTEAGEAFSQQSWLRLPVGAELVAKAGPQGCRCWLKEGHLRFVDRGPAG